LSKIVVYLYLPHYQNSENKEMHNKMLEVEALAKRDGYDFHFYEGNGFISGVEFTSEDEAAQFIFKYLR
jgi:hypothetical protein